MRLVLVALLFGCAEKPPAASCQDASGCRPGQICLEGACAEVCRADLDCEPGFTCRGDVCVTGVRPNAPRLEGIDGSAGVDGQPGHAAHHVERHAVLQGANLAGALVTLTLGDQAWELDICEETDDRLTVALPDGLTSGATYQLAVATQAGSCSASLPVLQGVAGRDGSPDTPQQIRDKLLTVDGGGSELDADTLDGRDASAFADAVHSHPYLPLASLSVAQAATLTAGGDASALHTHAATPAPWSECGTVYDLLTNSCTVGSHPWQQYEYGVPYNSPEPMPVHCTGWNRGLRVYNREPYLVNTDDPMNGGSIGGFLIYRGTNSVDDATCTAPNNRHHYWRISASNGMEMFSSNGCVNPPVYCRERR